MTREEIIRMARSDDWAVDVSLKWDDFFVRFANLVAASEREACARVCEEYETANDITATWLNIVADAIRARGEKA